MAPHKSTLSSYDWCLNQTHSIFMSSFKHIYFRTTWCPVIKVGHSKTEISISKWKDEWPNKREVDPVDHPVEHPQCNFIIKVRRSGITWIYERIDFRYKMTCCFKKFIVSNTVKVFLKSLSKTWPGERLLRNKWAECVTASAPKCITHPKLEGSQHWAYTIYNSHTCNFCQQPTKGTPNSNWPQTTILLSAIREAPTKKGFISKGISPASRRTVHEHTKGT